MAYLEPDSNPGSKPQRLSDKNYKNCALKQSNKFWHFMYPLTKHSIYGKKMFVSKCNFAQSVFPQVAGRQTEENFLLLRVHLASEHGSGSN